MAVGIIFLLSLLSVAQYRLSDGNREDADMQELLQQRHAQLRQEMIKVLEEMTRSQQRCSLAASQHWLLWAPAKALLMLFGLYRLCRKSSTDGDSGCHRGSVGNTVERIEWEADGEGKAEPGATLDEDRTLDGDKSLEMAGSSAAPPKQARPKNNFLTGPHPASGRSRAYKCTQMKIRKRPLLAPPSPPLGHVIRQRWASRGICRRGTAAAPVAPDGERTAPPPLPREQLNSSRVPAARAASAPLRREAPAARRGRR